MEPKKYWWLSLQSLFTPSEREDVTELANEYGGYKLHITFFFVHAWEFVLFLFNFKTKLIYFLNFFNLSQYFWLNKLFRLSSILLLTLNLRGRGGVGPDHQIINHNSKTALSSTSRFGDFCFYLLDTFWKKFSKIDSPGGCCSCFWNETSWKIEPMKFLFLLENNGNAERV